MGRLTAKRVELESVKSPRERNHRHWKERWAVWIDAGASIVALIVVLVLVAASVVILFRTSSTLEDRRFATSMLEAVGAAVAGFAFGKAKK